MATQPNVPKAQDELDMPTLKRVQKIIDEQVASYSSVDRLTVDEKELTVKQQLAVNKSIVAHLSDIKLIVDTVILEIKEKYE